MMEVGRIKWESPLHPRLHSSLLVVASDRLVPALPGLSLSQITFVYVPLTCIRL